MRAKERLEHLGRGGCRTNLFALLKSNNSLNTTVNGDVQRSEPKNKSRHLEMEIEQTAEFKNSVTVLAL